MSDIVFIFWSFIGLIAVYGIYKLLYYNRSLEIFRALRRKYGVSGNKLLNIHTLLDDGLEDAAKRLFFSRNKGIFGNELSSKWEKFKYDHKMKDYKSTANKLLDELEKKSTSYYSHHLSVLHTKQNELIYEDEFGDFHEERWDDYVERYYDDKLYPMLPSIKVGFLENTDELIGSDTYARKLRDILINCVKIDAELFEPPSLVFGYHDEMSGRDYESYCKDHLESFGWNVRKTPVTGDRGADLIADKNGISVAIQCKRHSEKVGNKAIQEAHSAKGIYGTGHAAVITNCSFTPQAVMDAKSLNVKLVANNLIEKLEPQLN